MSSGWLSGWSYRKKIIVTGSTAGAVTDYQIMIIVHYGSGSDTGKDIYLEGNGRTDFGDVRFTADDGVTELPYWIEYKVDGDRAVVWVKIPSIPAYPNTTSIYIYYGNPNATTTSNPANTFLFFDDFNTGTETLTFYGAGTWTRDTANSVLNWTPTTTGDALAVRDVGIANVRVITRCKPVLNKSVGASARVTDASNWYNSILNQYNQYHSMEKKVGGSWSKLTYASKTVTLGNWYRIHFKLYGTTLKSDAFTDDYSPYSSLSTTDSSFQTQTKHGLYCYYDTTSTQYNSFDYLAIGKYIDPEPTLSVETPTQPTESITPVTSDALTVTTLNVTQVTQPTESIVSVSSDALATALLSVTQVTYPSEAIASVLGDALATTAVGVGGYPAESIASVSSDALATTSTEVITAPTAPTKKAPSWWWLIPAFILLLAESERRKKK